MWFPCLANLSPIETLTLVCCCISSSCVWTSSLPSYLLPQCFFKTSRGWRPLSCTILHTHPHTHSHAPLQPPPFWSILGYCCGADKPKQRALKLYSLNQYIMWHSDKARLPALLSRLCDLGPNPQNCNINVRAATMTEWHRAVVPLPNCENIPVQVLYSEKYLSCIVLQR